MYDVALWTVFNAADIVQISVFSLYRYGELLVTLQHVTVSYYYMLQGYQA